MHDSSWLDSLTWLDTPLVGVRTSKTRWSRVKARITSTNCGMTLDHCAPAARHALNPAFRRAGDNLILFYAPLSFFILCADVLLGATHEWSPTIAFLHWRPLNGPCLPPGAFRGSPVRSSTSAQALASLYFKGPKPGQRKGIPLSLSVANDRVRSLHQTSLRGRQFPTVVLTRVLIYFVIVLRKKLSTRNKSFLINSLVSIRPVTVIIVETH